LLTRFEVVGQGTFTEEALQMLVRANIDPKHLVPWYLSFLALVFRSLEEMKRNHKIEEVAKLHLQHHKMKR
jgi:hypothetical protein